MSKLELKHLAGYLPYGLKGINEMHGFKTDIKCIQTDGDIVHSFGKSPIRFIKPILRPLSYLNKEIEVNEEKFVPIDRLFGSAYRIQGFKHYLNIFNGGFELTMTKENRTIYADFNMYQKLFEWHFDIYGLIEKGLAIDINTIK